MTVLWALYWIRKFQLSRKERYSILVNVIDHFNQYLSHLKPCCVYQKLLVWLEPIRCCHSFLCNRLRQRLRENIQSTCLALMFHFVGEWSLGAYSLTSVFLAWSLHLFSALIFHWLGSADFYRTAVNLDGIIKSFTNMMLKTQEMQRKLKYPWMILQDNGKEESQEFHLIYKLFQREKKDKN